MRLWMPRGWRRFFPAAKWLSGDWCRSSHAFGGSGCRTDRFERTDQLIDVGAAEQVFGPVGCVVGEGRLVEPVGVHYPCLGQVGDDDPDEVDLGAGVGPVIQEP